MQYAYLVLKFDKIFDNVFHNFYLYVLALKFN
jgi:hypothetical protein